MIGKFRISRVVTLKYFTLIQCLRVLQTTETDLLLYNDKEKPERDAIDREELATKECGRQRLVGITWILMCITNNRKNVTDMQCKVSSWHSTITFIECGCSYFQILHQLSMKSWKHYVTSSLYLLSIVLKPYTYTIKRFGRPIYRTQTTVFIISKYSELASKMIMCSPLVTWVRVSWPLCQTELRRRLPTNNLAET